MIKGQIETIEQLRDFLADHCVRLRMSGINGDLIIDTRYRTIVWLDRPDGRHSYPVTFQAFEHMLKTGQLRIVAIGD